MVSRRGMGRNYPWVIDEEWPGIIHRLSMTNWTNYPLVINEEWDGITCGLLMMNGTELPLGYRQGMGRN
jgi:hypothetical protein